MQNPVPTELSVEADDDFLYSDGSDVTRIVVKVLDQVGNRLSFYFNPIQISVCGNGVLIGPDSVSLQGGVYAFWVKSSSESGDINIVVREERLGDKEIKIRTIEGNE